MKKVRKTLKYPQKTNASKKQKGKTFQDNEKKYHILTENLTLGILRIL